VTKKAKQFNPRELDLTGIAGNDDEWDGDKDEWAQEEKSGGYGATKREKIPLIVTVLSLQIGNVFLQAGSGGRPFGKPLVRLKGRGKTIRCLDQETGQVRAMWDTTECYDFGQPGPDATVAIRDRLAMGGNPRKHRGF